MGESPIYLNIGCGYDAPAGWLNVDASPTARIQKLPIVGPVLSRWSGNSRTFPEAVRYGDLRKPSFLPRDSVEAVFASHVLEHLALGDMRLALRNIFQMLRPGGRLRLIVPDLQERARRYLEQAGNPSASHDFMRSCYLGSEARSRGALGLVKNAFGNAAHLWMWDEPSVRAELEAAGFVGIRKARFGDSGDAMFDLVENEDRFVDDGIEEVALEAFKPER